MAPVRRSIAAFLIADLLALSLTGCGTVPATAGRLDVRPAATSAAAAPALPATRPATAKAAPTVALTRGQAPTPLAIAAPPATPAAAAQTAHEAAPSGLFDHDYDPAVRYTATGADAADARALEGEIKAQGGGGSVGPVGANWGLIGGAIGGVLVGGSLIGYAIYTGMVGTKDLLYPQDKEDLVKKPDAYGYAYESITFDGHDGTDLRGWYVPAATPTTKAVLLLHGHTSNKDRFFAKYAGWLHDDYNLFIYDSRFHGESDGNITTLGWHERRDAALALTQLKTRGNTSIGVMGESMGGAVAIGVAADKPEIKACWADCAFDSLHDAIAPRAKARKYPLPEYVAWSVVKTATVRSRHNVASADPIRCIKSIAPRPVYLVHGGADDDTLPLNSQKLYAEAAEPKTYWTVAGADHAQSWEKQPLEYQTRLQTFFGGSL